jgi:transcriptional regulator with XRE-family HTH domain
MNTIAPNIKRRRIQLGMTQKEFADKIHLSEKAWQNIENGLTKLDIERLNEIAQILDISLTDLINSQESFYVHQVNDKPNVGFSAREVVIHNDLGEAERKLFDKLLKEKDEQINELREDLKNTKVQLNKLIAKLTGKL